MKNLYKILIIGVLFSLTGLTTRSLNYKDSDITGVWFTKENKSKLEITKGPNNEFTGKIIWLKEPVYANGQLKKDTKNPDKKLHNRQVIGITVLNKLKYIDTNTWTEGTIYDPESGNTYSCNIKLDNINTISIRGYIGFSFIGRTETWTRTTK